MNGYTPAMRRGLSRDLDEKLGLSPRPTFVGLCLCERLVVEYDDGSSLNYWDRKPHACPGPDRGPLPLAAPRSATVSQPVTKAAPGRLEGVVKL